MKEEIEKYQNEIAECFSDIDMAKEHIEQINNEMVDEILKYFNEKGWSMRKTAMAIGISPAHLHDIYKGRRKLGANIVDKIYKIATTPHRG